MLQKAAEETRLIAEECALQAEAAMIFAEAELIEESQKLPCCTATDTGAYMKQVPDSIINISTRFLKGTKTKL